MGVMALIGVAVGVCWICILILGWLLCRAAQRGDEQPIRAHVVPLEPERLSSAAGR
jgi:hypothetical protein